MRVFLFKGSRDRRNNITVINLFIAALLFQTAAFAGFAGETFRFHYEPGIHYRIEAWVDEEIYRNDVLAQRVKLKNVGEIQITSVRGDQALHEGTFSYLRSPDLSDSYVLEREYPSRFFRDIYGRYTIDDGFFMPVVRNVPTFPEGEVNVGDQWKSGAHEAHDFRDVFGIESPVILPAAASYQYLGNTEIDGERVARISINYVINYTLQYGTAAGVLLPYRVVGYFNQLFNWNLDRSAPHSYKENFDYIFIMSNGEIYEYTGKSRGIVTITKKPEAVIESIERRLNTAIPGVEVSLVDEGILINIGEILFRFDSDELGSDTGPELDNIVDVLKDFSERRIRVIGHTDSRGPEDYNLTLSIRRARRIVEELTARMHSSRDRITYMGMGESSPIADNDTEEGRRRNRRVEIIILNERSKIQED